MPKQLSLVFATLVLLTACAGDKQEVVVIRTSMGEIVFAFHEDVPGHVAGYGQGQGQNDCPGSFEGQVRTGGEPGQRDGDSNSTDRGGQRKPSCSNEGPERAIATNHLPGVASALRGTEDEIGRGDQHGCRNGQRGHPHHPRGGGHETWP